MDTQLFWDKVSTKQRRIAEAAWKFPGASLKSVAHHIDGEWMYFAYELTRKDGALGLTE
jgi:hypothetical protein